MSLALRILGRLARNAAKLRPGCGAQAKSLRLTLLFLILTGYVFTLFISIIRNY
jgi:hypothetical protein